MGRNILLGLILVSVTRFLIGEESFQPHCDLIGKHLSRNKSEDQSSCWLLCQENLDCSGAVFVSGWNRCFLKSTVKRKAMLKFYSGERGASGQYDRDYSGKDLKRYVVKTKEECKKHCELETQCTGFTYLEGYQDCWIKNTKGKIFEKIFYCRIKKEPSLK